ncbi:MAG: right-handed parallel beta-helix repeat-containing protein [Planctomycetota bacterium]|jgi:hypothetical protein
MPRYRAVLALCALGVAAAAPADVIDVPDDHPSIQAAIDAASGGDEIVVAAGTYAELIDLLGKAVTLRSADGAAVTIIDGGPVVSDEHSVIRCVSGEGPGTVIDGFTITGGRGTRVVLGPGVEFRDGGGMYNDASSPTVMNCVFSGNELTASCSSRGAGMFNLNASPTVIDCLFVDNVGLGGNCGGISTGRGGGMYNEESSPLLLRCVFTNNRTEAAGGAAGGGIRQVGGDPILVDCEFTGNTAAEFVPIGNAFGGGVAVSGAGPTMTNCRFVGNQAGLGGGLSAIGGTPSLLNCLFFENVTDPGAGLGGAIFYADNALSVVNCTIVSNTADASGGAMHSWDGGKFSDAEVVNSILWDNAPAPFGGPVPSVSFSIVEGGWPGPGNVDQDPAFMDLAAGDLRLTAASPAVDAGHNWAVPLDSADYDGDGVTAELFPVDLDGQPRFSADDQDFDAGCGSPVVVDMGAHELPFDAAPVLFADIDGDGAVEVDDLVQVILDWGACEDACCLSDLDRSGAVDVDDLVAVILNWSG